MSATSGPDHELPAEQAVDDRPTTPELEAQEGEQRPRKGFLEQTWDFFASVPVATVMIFVIAAASVMGSLIEQEGMYASWKPPADFYPERYGPFWGNLLFKTGMTRMYTSWWFLSLLFLLGASLIICSLERFIPLFRAVQRPNTSPPEGFVKHLKHRFTYRLPAEAGPLAPLESELRSRRYSVVLDGSRLYADKGRWGRWGPYITHIGLILILAGGMMRGIPGFYFDQSIWVRDNATMKVPGTDWFVENKKFTVEYHDNGQPSAYKTEAAVIENGIEVKQFTISMNQPLWHKWVELYQSSYKQGLGWAKVAVTDRVSGKTLGEFEVDIAQPATSFTAGRHQIKVKEYYPDFGLDDRGKPVSRSSEPNNPGLVLEVTDPSGKVDTVWYFILFPDMEFNKNLPYKFKTVETLVTSTTGLKVKKDLGIPVIYLGLLIMSIGVCFTFYLAHRRYWALIEGGLVIVGGWTNRNQNGLKQEMEAIANRIDPAANPIVNPLEVEER